MSLFPIWVCPAYLYQAPISQWLPHHHSSLLPPIMSSLLHAQTNLYCFFFLCLAACFPKKNLYNPPKLIHTLQFPPSQLFLVCVLVVSLSVITVIHQANHLLMLQPCMHSDAQPWNQQLQSLP